MKCIFNMLPIKIFFVYTFTMHGAAVDITLCNCAFCFVYHFARCDFPNNEMGLMSLRAKKCVVNLNLKPFMDRLCRLQFSLHVRLRFDSIEEINLKKLFPSSLLLKIRRSKAGSTLKTRARQTNLAARLVKNVHWGLGGAGLCSRVQCFCLSIIQFLPLFSVCSCLSLFYLKNV